MPFAPRGAPYHAREAGYSSGIPALGGRSSGAGGFDGLDDHLCLGQGIFVGQSEMDQHDVIWRRESREPRRSAASQGHRRLAGRQINDPHVAKSNASPKSGAERLGAGFLGGEALRVRGGPARPSRPICAAQSR